VIAFSEVPRAGNLPEVVLTSGNGDVPLSISEWCYLIPKNTVTEWLFLGQSTSPILSRLGEEILIPFNYFRLLQI
jgi:hypothetical protein